MIYEFLEIADKGEGWKVVTVKEAIENGKTLANVSMNKIDKKTTLQAFANFDTFAVGQTVEADYWESPTGRGYLFAPKPKAVAKGNGAFKAKQIEEVQERTKEHVQVAQENKNHAVLMAAAQRDAVLMVITFEKETPFPTDQDLQSRFTFWREYFIKEAQNRASQPF